MNHDRNLVTAVCICLALVGTAAAIRLSQSYPQISGTTASKVSVSKPIPGPDASFYGADDSGAPATVVKNPVQAVAPKCADCVTAEAYLVGNAQTGKVYLEYNASKVLPVASMSKLVTAFVATDELSATSLIEITPVEAAAPPDASNLKAGEEFTMPQLLYPMLLDSSNVAAEALASSTDRARFLGAMSAYAWEIGMPSTFFADPSGVNPHNQSTAHDFFALAQYLYKSRPDILAITRTPKIVTATTTEHGAHEFDSIQPFVNDPRFLGGKTGHTPEAGDTMMTILRINSQPVVFIVLASDDRTADTKLLINKVQGKVE